MAGALQVDPQALGTVPEGDVRQCMFCGVPLVNRGEGFIDHIRAKPECHEAHQAWLERLDDDRPGG